MNRRNLVSTGSLFLLALLFLGLVILSGLLFKGWRIDLTENRQYTLSEGTYSVLEGMQEPVTIYFFFSEGASGDFPQLRSYARWVDEMLADMADRSGGKLTVRRIDPAPFSPEEDQAASFGLQAVPVGAAGDALYFGLAASNSLDAVQTIPFLNPAKQPGDEKDPFLFQIRLPYLLSLMANRSFDSFVPGINDLVFGNEEEGIVGVGKRMERGTAAFNDLNAFKDARDVAKRFEHRVFPHFVQIGIIGFIFFPFDSILQG